MPNKPQQISVTRSTRAKTLPPIKDLGFGRFFSDHMFICDYTQGRGWENPRIVPYQPFQMDPGAAVLHYGQSLFEGMKAFRDVRGQLRLFRSAYHAQRFAKGAQRLCMPSFPEELFTQAVSSLASVDERWAPAEKGTALYIRPTLIGTEAFLGVRPSNNYCCFIVCSPVGAYYEEGLKPVKIWIEDEYIRAAPGGLGAVKAAANYASSLLAASRAKERGYAQVLWLDAKTREYVEEVGTMNLFVRINDEIITPALDGSILNGATRDCVLTLLKNWKLKITERPLAVREVLEAQRTGALKEVFGSGTAAVISPVGELGYRNERLVVGNGKMGEVSQRLFTEITAIQYGEKPDTYGWLSEPLSL